MHLAQQMSSEASTVALAAATPDTLMGHDWLKRGRNAEAVGLSIGFSLVREVVPCGASQFFGRTV